MIANLPLLFANGNPTGLSKITASELEKFITFMVTCSWGHDTAKDIRKPPWWPNDVPFSHPFVKPFTVPKDWDVKLRNLVKQCYDYHKSAFLLVFSAQLARYPRKRLRYVDNRDHTTSLYYRPSGRLLVTFRNENIYYDKDEPIEIDDEPPVKSADIYLCDNCDSHFDNLEVLKVHERLCNDENSSPSSSCNGGLAEFLSALKLQVIGEKKVLPKHNDSENKPRNSRGTTNIDRGPPYPFSSLAYMKNVKSNVQRDTSYSRERIERYCCTNTPISKCLNSKGKTQQFPVRYRRPIDYWQRRHIFPNQRKKKILDIKGQLLYLKCQRISVNVEKMSLDKIQEYIDQLKCESQNRVRQADDKDVVFVDCSQAEEVERTSVVQQQVETECEVIDLCSDEEGSGNENCDPRGGVACVMRSTAPALRRAGARRAAPAPAPPPPPTPSPRHPHRTHAQQLTDYIPRMNVI